MKISSSIWGTWLNSKFAGSEVDRSEVELGLLKQAVLAPQTSGNRAGPSRAHEHGLQLLEAAGSQGEVGVVLGF